jgi:hypothetical protein
LIREFPGCGERLRLRLEWDAFHLGEKISSLFRYIGFSTFFSCKKVFLKVAPLCGIGRFSLRFNGISPMGIKIERLIRSFKRWSSIDRESREEEK